jgi:hypothetical protein
MKRYPHPNFRVMTQSTLGHRKIPFRVLGYLWLEKRGADNATERERKLNFSP